MGVRNRLNELISLLNACQYPNGRGIPTRIAVDNRWQRLNSSEALRLRTKLHELARRICCKLKRTKEADSCGVAFGFVLVRIGRILDHLPAAAVQFAGEIILRRNADYCVAPGTRG
jgi:hypothetical protein